MLHSSEKGKVTRKAPVQHLKESHRNLPESTLQSQNEIQSQIWGVAWNLFRCTKTAFPSPHIRDLVVLSSLLSNGILRKQNLPFLLLHTDQRKD